MIKFLYIACLISFVLLGCKSTINPWASSTWFNLEAKDFNPNDYLPQNKYNKQGIYFLSFVLEHARDIALVDSLEAYGYSFNKRSRGKKQWFPIMHVVVKNKDVNFVLSVINRKGVLINTRTSLGWTPLMVAVRTGRDLSIIEALVTKNANVNAKDRYYRSILDMAAQNEDKPEIVEFLHKNGAKHSKYYNTVKNKAAKK